MSITKTKILFLMVSLLLILGIATNPKKDDYILWSKEKVVSSGENFLEKGLYSLVASPLIDMNTTSKDLLFFSIYETTFDERNSIKVIGVFNNFLPISGKSSQ